ncbi:DUF1385 domain-containing protein [Anaerolineales bacterium]
MSETQSSSAGAGEIQFSYGGQAVIEGVLMRGAHNMAVAVRNPEGQIVVHEQALNKTLYRGRIARTPFVRGVIGLWDALVLGTRALMWAADVAIGEDEDLNFNGPIGWATLAISLLIGVGFFFLLPTFTATGIGNLLGITQASGEGLGDFLGYQPLPIGGAATLINLIEAVVQLGILIAYIWLIGRVKDVRRLFQYHGAEHKTINAYEAGDELTPETIIKYPIEHPRCGTAFLLDVVFISVIVFSLLGRPPILLLILSRIILIPVIAGIAYEFLRFMAQHSDNPIVAFTIKPNLALQHLTTNEPDLDICEVAIVAFKRVLVSEGLLEDSEAIIPPAKPEAAAYPPENKPEPLPNN